MKNIYLFIIYVLFSLWAHSQNPDTAAINNKSSELLQTMQTHLVELSSSIPLLQGIEKIQVNTDGYDIKKRVHQIFYFSKNVHMVTITPKIPNGSTFKQIANTPYAEVTVTQPVIAGGSYTVVDPGGIEVYAAFLDGPPFRGITKLFQISNDHNAPRFVYYVGVNEKDGPDAQRQKEAVLAILNQIGNEFITFLKAQGK